MGRLIRDWKADKVADSVVAPHRYMWAGTILPNGEPAKDLDLCKDYAERKANMPYVEGEVVYVQRGESAAKARIVNTYWERNHYGELREYYTVQFETVNGLWSKLWEKTYPGPIQRGYKNAGLAPDVKD